VRLYIAPFDDILMFRAFRFRLCCCRQREGQRVICIFDKPLCRMVCVRPLYIHFILHSSSFLAYFLSFSLSPLSNSIFLSSSPIGRWSVDRKASKAETEYGASITSENEWPFIVLSSCDVILGDDDASEKRICERGI
jgi:hypothetical protein